ncbi:trypsin-like peptidase domain-containing protein [Oculatella sp. LEGE 06141]|uniref:HhoA/HhoB/HtrA family serine endopeptidase n=1 Tax=Oculatella sp. LEGE 06141 TaxID=1828648 RepID=UPI0018814D4E|nr:HhoA/HhoB/HtrA family serine endopeptidase [Oculatella sp. LEGE 06141]MBE9183068.1 trypsin-like peptidase domain-containing protein [Oculatella sp. LEGE 06141]
MKKTHLYSDKPSATGRQSPLMKGALYASLLFTGAGAVVLGDRLVPRADAEPTSQPQIISQVPGGTDGTGGSSSRILAATDSNFIAEAVQQVGPSVVRIDSSRTVAARTPEIFNDPLVQRFFGRSGAPVPPSSQIRQGTGSGFIIDANGVILTNAHVVDRADQVTVTLKDGRNFTGRVLGTDSVTDVAVIKIEANSLPVAQIGNSDSLQPGEWAIAIGNPLGLDNTVTAGIISATDRSSAQVGVPDRRIGFIQTDAAINPGNSGGPLLNQQGQVVGMNTAIIGGAQGLGFAIPINSAQRIANDLIADGRVDHPYLGVEMATITPQLKNSLSSNPNNQLSVEEDEGILVVRVVPNSPAARAGIRAGDVIRQIGNQPVTDSAAVQAVVEDSEIGRDLPIELRRNGQTVSLSVSPAVLPTGQG